MASLVYNNAKELFLNADIDLSADTIKIALLTSSYTPDQDAHDFYDDVSANEVANSGTYAAGGATLTVTVSQDNTDDEAVFDATDVSWTGTTITARYAVIYKSTGTASTSALICLIDFGSNQSSSSGTFAITFASEGIMNLN
ncbi:hypothetical protein M0R04_13835 [Candidatus Dojkabacteria bacterium]|jgi:hypothetical protein|nr:hypothetical protein [Candidatus Dojkabacteria bacterium]